MTEKQLIESIIKNRENYRKTVFNILGDGHPLADDMVHDGAIKILELVRSGKIQIDSITYNQEINHSFFKKVLMRMCFDFKRRKVNRVFIPMTQFDLVRLSDKKGGEGEEIYRDKYGGEVLTFLKRKLREFGKVNQSNSFHVDIWKLVYFEGYKLKQLSVELQVNWKTLNQSKKIINKQVILWLKKRQEWEQKNPPQKRKQPQERKRPQKGKR